MESRETVFRTETEQEAAQQVAELFSKSPDPVSIKLDNFTKYVRRVPLKRFLVMYEIYKRILPVKGSIVECGVFRGFGTMGWAKLSAILEPENLTRRIYGFDSFSGFPAVAPEDSGGKESASNAVGDLAADSHEELSALIDAYDRDRYLGHIPKVELIKGDICSTVASFVRERPHLLVSLLFLDCDLYEPTLAALKSFVPRMPAGALVVFDELDNPKWPGETLAMLEYWAGRPLCLERLEWDPYMGIAEVK